MSVKRVQVSYLTLSRSLSPNVRIALLAERKRPGMRLSPCFVRLDHARNRAPTWHTSSMIATTSSSVKA